MVKRQFERTTYGSLYAAMIGAILNVVEGYYESGQLLSALVDVQDERGALEALRSGNEVRVRAYAPWLKGVEEEATIGSSRVIVSGVSQAEIGHGGKSLQSLYLEAPQKTIYYDRDLLKGLASETSQSLVEFMIIYTDYGSAVIIEGERLRVSVPEVRSIAVLHTHPEPHCVLSRKDVESGLELMMVRGLFMGAVTVSCANVMLRVGLLEEEDLLKIKSGELGSLKSVRFSSLLY